jgi:hypothetical protein
MLKKCGSRLYRGKPVEKPHPTNKKRSGCSRHPFTLQFAARGVGLTHTYRTQ